MSRYAPEEETESGRPEDAPTQPPRENGWASETGSSQPRTLPEAIARLEALAAELEAKSAEVAQQQDRYLRERAEVENFKRRMQRDKLEALRFANEPLLRDLLPVIDNLERAVRAARQAQDGASAGGKADAALVSLVTGVEMVLNQFAEVLARNGVARVETVERTFDPAEHEALAQIESHHHPAGTVLEEHTAGYRLHDRLLRAAQVTVAKTPSSES